MGAFVGALVLTLVQPALNKADTESHEAQSHEREDAEQAVLEVPVVEEEAILAEAAYQEDHQIAAQHPAAG